MSTIIDQGLFTARTIALQKSAQIKQVNSQAKYMDAFRTDLTESLSFLIDKVVSAKNQA